MVIITTVDVEIHKIVHQVTPDHSIRRPWANIVTQLPDSESDPIGAGSLANRTPSKLATSTVV
jgi:hypothetical protein